MGRGGLRRGADPVSGARSSSRASLADRAGRGGAEAARGLVGRGEGGGGGLRRCVCVSPFLLPVDSALGAGVGVGVVVTAAAGQGRPLKPEQRICLP